MKRRNDYIGTYGCVHRAVDDPVSTLSLRTACGRDLVDGLPLDEVPSKDSVLCKRCFGLPVRRSRKQQYRDHVARAEARREAREQAASKGLTTPPDAPTL